MAITPKGIAATAKKANAGGGNLPVSKKMSGNGSARYSAEPASKGARASGDPRSMSCGMPSCTTGSASQMVSHMNGTTQCMQMTPDQKKKYNK